jgi:hypothetical protein
VRFLNCFAVIGILLCPSTGQGKTIEDPELSPQNVVESIELSQTWLNTFQKDDGLYHYIFRPWGYTPDKDDSLYHQTNKNAAPGQTVKPPRIEQVIPYPDDDNIVRQILSYWALIKSTDFKNNDQIMANIKNFEDGLEKYIVIQDSEYGPALFVQFRETMKVNSTALYLAALLSKKDRGLPLSKTQENHIEYAVNGLKVFAAPEAGFYYYHDTDRINFISSYGSGEAQLALAQYVNKTKDEDLYQSIQKRFDEYFNLYYANSFSNPMSYRDKMRIGYHTWALYYLNEIDKFKPVDYEKYVRPLVQYSFDFKKENEYCANNPCIYSMAMWDSSSVEGLAAAYPLILKYEKDPEFKKQVKAYLDDAVSYLLTLQVNSVEEYEEKTEKTFKNNPDHLIGGFCDWPDCPYMRNEVTMHVAAALMAYYNLFYR